MKQPLDKFTLDAFDKPARGCLRIPDAKSTAHRQREFRQRQKFNFLVFVARNQNSKEVNQ
jgi:hypothetical protein